MLRRSRRKQSNAMVAVSRDPVRCRGGGGAASDKSLVRSWFPNLNLDGSRAHNSLLYTLETSKEHYNATPSLNSYRRIPSH